MAGGQQSAGVASLTKILKVDYSWDADLYQQKHAFVYQYGSDLIAWLRPQPGEKILDVGCGTGELSAQIHRLGAEVVGIDRSAEMIHRARQQFPEVSFYVMDATQPTGLPQFDAIFSNAALHWILDAETVTRQLYRYLIPGGRLVVELGGKGNVEQLISALNQQRTRLGHRSIPAAEQWFFPSLEEYTTALEKVGFQVQLVQYFHRDTSLSDTQEGVKDWLRMFGKKWLEDLSEDDEETLLQSVQEALYSKLYREGAWYVDYRRLRVVAVKVN